MSVENTTEKTAPAFKLEEGKFIRIEDGKEIAHLHEGGEINGLHHTQEKFRDELKSLIPVAPSMKRAGTRKISDDAPRSLYDKQTGDLTPEVVEWRRDNWTDEQFNAVYEGRL